MKSGPTAALERLPGVWAPQPGPQTEAITADWADELFYGGAAGGGKSDFLLGDFLQDVLKYGGAWQGILFRRTYPELEQLIYRSREFYPQTGAVWLEQAKMWRWPNGAVLRMRYLERDADTTRYLGHEYTWIGWDELTQWPTDYAYRYLRSRLRSPHDVPTKRIRAAANPGGVGHHWVKAYFVTPDPLGFTPIEDGITGNTRIFIPAKLRDNRILLRNDVTYEGRLRGLGSSTLVRAMLEGDWSVVEGAFFDEWSTEKHVVPPFTIPPGWLRFRSMDWGSATPGVVQWWAVVGDDGLELPVDGRWLPRGALVLYREWYIGIEGNVGLKLTAEEVGAGIKQREANDGTIVYGVLDPAAFSSDGGPSIAERLVLGGAYFRRADNARVRESGALGGWDMLRSRLRGDGSRPAIFFFSTCVHTIRTIPALQHDPDRPEDVLKKGDDHAGDACRYACMSRPWVPRPAEPEKPTTPVFTAVSGGRVISNMSVYEIVEAKRRKRERDI